jgi:hypothetical protein
VVVGILPGIAAWTVTELTQVLSGADTTLEEVASQRPDLYLNGLFSLRMGYVLVSLLLSSMYSHIEERRFKAAAGWAVFGAFLSATGMVHTFTLSGDNLSPMMGLFPNARSRAFTLAYMLCAVVLALAGIGDAEEGGLLVWLRSVGKALRPDSFQTYPQSSLSRRGSPVRGFRPSVSPADESQLRLPLLENMPLPDAA